MSFTIFTLIKKLKGFIFPLKAILGYQLDEEIKCRQHINVTSDLVL